MSKRWLVPSTLRRRPKPAPPEGSGLWCWLANHLHEQVLGADLAPVREAISNEIIVQQELAVGG